MAPVVPYRGRFFVEKTLGLKNAVGVAVIGSALILKAMSFMTLAIGLLVAKGLEEQATFEDDARGWKVSSPNGDFTASGPCPDGGCVKQFHRGLDAAATWGAPLLILLSLLFTIFGVLALAGASGHVWASRLTFKFMLAGTVLSLFSIFDFFGFLSFLLFAAGTVVARSHWIQLCEEATSLPRYAVVEAEPPKAKH